jgi:monofunctional biosynthetic peptidoglycan transglycosylase
MTATRRRWLWKSLGWMLLSVLALAAVAALWLVLTWPDVAALAEKPPKTTAFIEAAKARGEDIRWTWVPYSRISFELKKAVVVAEDLSFFSHHGFDTHELKIAAREATEGKRVRGASTITQQLAKNLWLSPSRSPIRKLRELLLTRQLESRLSKRRILELYLNVVELGPGLYGAEAASRHYFGIPAAHLDADQAAQLAASLPRPKTWHPGVTSRGYAKAVSRVRTRAAQIDWLDGLL